MEWAVHSRQLNQRIWRNENTGGTEKREIMAVSRRVSSSVGQGLSGMGIRRNLGEEGCAALWKVRVLCPDL